MGQIKKAFVVATAFIGIFLILCGLTSIILDVLMYLRYAEKSQILYLLKVSSEQRTLYTFGVFMVFGCFLLVPGILSIVLVFTKNFSLMVAILVFNVLSMLITVGCLIYVVTIMNSWEPVHGLCVTIFRKCRCFQEVNYYEMPSSCEFYNSTETLLVATCINLGLSGILVLISSFISCFSLCNVEEENSSCFVLQQPAVVSFSSNCYFDHPEPPPSYSPRQFHLQPIENYSTHDKAMLIENQDM